MGIINLNESGYVYNDDKTEWKRKVTWNGLAPRIMDDEEDIK